MNHKAAHLESALEDGHMGALDCNAKPFQEECISDGLHMMELAGGSQHTGAHHLEQHAARTVERAVLLLLCSSFHVSPEWKPGVRRTLQIR